MLKNNKFLQIFNLKLFKIVTRAFIYHFEKKIQRMIIILPGFNFFKFLLLSILSLKSDFVRKRNFPVFSIYFISLSDYSERFIKSHILI